MTVEKRLRDALHAIDDYEPSPDLFARVAGSVEEDRAHRRRVLRTVLFMLFGGAALALFVGAQVIVTPAGRTQIPVWATDLSARLVMALVLLTLGPSFRRLGRNYVEDIYGVTGSGPDVLRLLDIAFYLVFIGNILGSPVASRLGDTVALTTGLQDGLMRIGLFLLVMGILHSLTLAILPVSGLVFSWVQWRARVPSPEMGTEGARQAARAAVWAAIVLTLAVGLGALITIPNLFVGLIDG